MQNIKTQIKSENNPLFICYEYYKQALNLDKTKFNEISELKRKSYEQVNDLVATIIPLANINGSDAFWIEGARDLIVTIIFAMLEIMELDQSLMPIEKFNLATVATLVYDEKKDQKLCKWLKNLPKTSKAYKAGARFFLVTNATCGGFFSKTEDILRDIFNDDELMDKNNYVDITEIDFDNLQTQNR